MNNIIIFTIIISNDLIMINNCDKIQKGNRVIYPHDKHMYLEVWFVCSKARL